jgi:ABC-2 type transport system ATP-binding protein
MKTMTPATGTPALVLADVAKSFGPVAAVDGLSLTVPTGSTVALLGPNGAGKTTTLSILLGLLAPDRGTVELLGQSPAAAVGAGRVGAMVQDGGLPTGARVGELLRMLSGLYRDPLPVEQVIVMAQLEGLERRRTDRLSGGQSQRLRVAVALIGDPDVLVIDEPTAAMDVEARRRFWRTMRHQAEQGKTILFSTHYLEEADAYADRVVVMGMGKVLADAAPAALRASLGSKSIRFVVPHAADREFAVLPGLPGVTSAEVRGSRVELRSADAEATVRAALASWPDLADLEVGALGLEDTFVALTSAAGVAVTANGRSH